MGELANKHCTACHAKTEPLKGKELLDYALQISSWKIINDHHIEKEFTFPNFKEALDFTNKLGALAEKEGHHPDIYLSWGKVKISLWTHNINGLSENDFILAAKCDDIKK